MIVNRNGQYLPETVHDHEISRSGLAGGWVEWGRCEDGQLRGLVVMCYYELPPVQREIGYDPAPYIAAVSRRRLESYGPQIAAAEAGEES